MPPPVSPSLVRWFARTASPIATATHLLQTLHSGFWIGVTSDQTFQQFEGYPYHSLADDDPLDAATHGFEPWERNAWHAHFASCRSLLLIAAGGGRELQAIAAEGAAEGAEIEAVDYDERLAAATNRRLARDGSPYRVATAPCYEVPAAQRTYDGIWVCRRFLSSIHGRERRVAFLRSLRERCHDRTVVMLAFYTRRRDGFSWRLNRWIGNGLRTVLRTPGVAVEQGDHLDTETPLYHHHYLEAAFRDELRAAGLGLRCFTTDWFGWAIAVPEPEPAALLETNS